MKKYVSLSFKITLFSTIIVLVATLLVGVIVYTETGAYFYNSTVRGLNAESQLLRNDIENAYIKIVNDIAILLKTPPIQGIIRSTENHGNDKLDSSNLRQWKARLATIFQSMLEVNPDYTQIRYIGLANKGKELVRVNQNRQGIYRVAESSLQAKENRTYYQQAKNLSQGSVMFSDINYNVENGKVEYPQVTTLRVLQPVYTAQQKTFGMLIINVNLLHYLRKVLIYDGIRYPVVLYNDFGDFLIYNNATKKLQYFPNDTALPNGFLGNKAITSTQQIVPYLTDNKEYYVITHQIYASQQKDHSVLTMSIVIPRSDLNEKDQGLAKNMLLWVLLVCCGAGFLIYLFAHRTMRYLTLMARSISESVQSRSKHLFLPTKLNDEVGLLAKAFEQKTQLLNKIALYDSLTGLPNRKNFVDHLEEAIQRANRSSRLVAVLYFDINKFKDVNDTYGHDFGDGLLVQFAYTLKACTRESAFCARIGGDEFCVILEDIPSIETMQEILQRYQNSLNKSYVVNGITFNVQIAGGVALFPNDASHADELLIKADKAMYVSKKNADGVFKLFCHTQQDNEKD